MLFKDVLTGKLIVTQSHTMIGTKWLVQDPGHFVGFPKRQGLWQIMILNISFDLRCDPLVRQIQINQGVSRRLIDFELLDPSLCMP